MPHCPPLSRTYHFLVLINPSVLIYHELISQFPLAIVMAFFVRDAQYAIHINDGDSRIHAQSFVAHRSWIYSYL